MAYAVADPGYSAIHALLGPTNTGKTHRAIERLLEHESGMIGLPLRLLAREVYDRVTVQVGEDQVALLTGEEKRIPARPRYWICTAEAMPEDLTVDFLALDEIQLAASPQRGHVFTDRLLRARGRIETWFLGAETMAPLVSELLPTARARRHPRLSRLSHRGRSSLAALPPRSAIVAFGVQQVYEMADAVRRRRGGAAVVLGALSPRARNAQVALYQSGEVDYLVATDAIGMGLNLDIDHVALAALRKFDGRDQRELDVAEIAQIVGRAGRYVRDGTFGTLAPLPELPPRLVLALEQHRFAPERRVLWRNPELDLSSVPALVHSLKERPSRGCLQLVHQAEDLSALLRLSARPDILARARSPEAIRLLWNVCQIPDFRKLLPDAHAALLGEIFLQLSGPGAQLDQDWLRRQVDEIDDARGDIDTLAMRIAAIRTWTYVSSHKSWLSQAGSWQQRTAQIEDRLSDALHDRLVQRFVDRSGRRSARHTSPAARAAGSRRSEAPPDREASDSPFAKLLTLHLRLRDDGPDRERAHWVDELVEAGFDAFEIETGGEIRFGDRRVGRLRRGSSLLHPEIALMADGIPKGQALRAERRLKALARDLVHRTLGPLRSLPRDDLSPPARGLVYQLEQGLGTTPSSDAREQLRGLTDRDRAQLVSSGVVLGRHAAFSRHGLRPQRVAWRFALSSAYFGAEHLPPPPPPGAASYRPPRDVAAPLALRLGYLRLGPRLVRADIAERAAAILAEAAPGPAEPRLLGLLQCKKSELAPLLAALGPAPKRRSRRRRPPARRARRASVEPP